MLSGQVVQIVYSKEPSKVVDVWVELKELLDDRGECCP